MKSLSRGSPFSFRSASFRRKKSGHLTTKGWRRFGDKVKKRRQQLQTEGQDADRRNLLPEFICLTPYIAHWKYIAISVFLFLFSSSIVCDYPVLLQWLLPARKHSAIETRWGRTNIIFPLSSCSSRAKRIVRHEEEKKVKVEYGANNGDHSRRAQWSSNEELYAPASSPV